MIDASVPRAIAAPPLPTPGSVTGRHPALRAVEWGVGLLIILAIVVAPLWYWQGGLIETEATVFVPQYHADASALRLVADPYRNDLGTYQSRELSYFIDYLDAHVYTSLLRAGLVVFVPVSALLASMLTVVLLLRGARLYPNVPVLTTLLILLAYVTNYTHLVTTGMLYRSAKPLLPPLVVGATLYLAAQLRIPHPSRRGDRLAPLVVFGLCCLGSLLDRQGFFLAATATAVLGMHAVVNRTRWDLVAGAAAAVGAMVVYNVAALPALVEYLHGYRPSLDYQRVPIEAMLEPLAWRRAVVLVLQGGALLAGGVSPRAFAVVLASLLVTALLTSWRPGKKDAAWVMVAGLQVALFAMMVARHPPVFLYVDHRLWYYPMALQALLILGLVVFLQRFLSGASTWRGGVVNVLLVLAVAGNVAGWDRHLSMQLRSHWFPGIYEQNVALKASLSDGRKRWYLDQFFEPFYEFSRSIVTTGRVPEPRPAAASEPPIVPSRP